MTGEGHQCAPPPGIQVPRDVGGTVGVSLLSNEWLLMIGDDSNQLHVRFRPWHARALLVMIQVHVFSFSNDCTPHKQIAWRVFPSGVLACSSVVSPRSACFCPFLPSGMLTCPPAVHHRVDRSSPEYMYSMHVWPHISTLPPWYITVGLIRVWK